jgi:ABC-type branched-subunit amino acid transport system substrate-binding protein
MLIADTVKRGATNAQSIRDALAKTQNLAAITGTISFDSHNQNISMDTVHYMETLPDLTWKPLGWN